MIGRELHTSTDRSFLAVWMLTLSLLSISLGACGAPNTGDHWIVLGRLPDGPDTIFVEIEPGFEKIRYVYLDAVEKQCGENLCRVLFYARGDKTPPRTSLREFISGGAFGVATLAVWNGRRPGGINDFTRWDCQRAGVEGAPLGALCGEGVKEDYSAVGTLASMAGIQKACRWPANNDVELLRKYLDTVSPPERQAQSRELFNLLYGNGFKSPDNIGECDSIRAKNEADVLAARKRLSSRFPPSEQPPVPARTKPSSTKR
jgi:hypothetical protein